MFKSNTSMLIGIIDAARLWMLLVAKFSRFEIGGVLDALNMESDSRSNRVKQTSIESVKIGVGFKT